MTEEKRYKGMTLGEMLFDAKLLNEFDSAVMKRDVKHLGEILRKIDFSDEVANNVIKAIFENPRKFGYDLEQKE